jgi:hypothetical protein
MALTQFPNQSLTTNNTLLHRTDSNVVESIISTLFQATHGFAIWIGNAKLWDSIAFYDAIASKQPLRVDPLHAGESQIGDAKCILTCKHMISKHNSLSTAPDSFRAYTIVVTPFISRSEQV